MNKLEMTELIRHIFAYIKDQTIKRSKKYFKNISMIMGNRSTIKNI